MLAFVTLLVEIEDDIEKYLTSENTPDKIILVKEHNFAESNQDKTDILKRITPASIKGEYEITPINCQWSELTNAVLKDKFEQHLKDNQKYRY